MMRQENHEDTRPQQRRPTVRRSFVQCAGYDVARWLARLVAVGLYGLRVAGREHWPAAGGALICANHQSVFDPPLVGLTCPRRLHYLARQTLFDVPILAPVIRFFDAIPIDRDGMGLAGLKETLRRVQAGEMVLLFPEGTRTRDGEVGPLKPGLLLIVRRSGVPLVPVGIDGAFQAWPRTQRLPRLGRIAVVIRPPIPAAEVAQLADEVVLARLHQEICLAHAQARRLRQAGRDTS
jgi:1-acyl-sn-glycerol-3-phosphate acyltransferase